VSKSKREVISGSFLLGLLEATGEREPPAGVKFLGLKKPDGTPELLGMLTVSQAIILVRSNSTGFEGGGSSNRCRYIREVRPLHKPLDDYHYWDDRAVIKYHADQRSGWAGSM
jgi:hypothetical protein